MIFSKKGTSIVEAIIVTLIVTIGIVGMYNIFTKSQKFSDSSTNRIKAISIAREGIEAVMNIRDTNWLIYGANRKNCWNTYNYDGDCIISDVDISFGSYIIYRDEITNRWKLESKTTGNFADATYKDNFEVMLDSDGFYTQTGSITNSGVLFTREIKISYPADAGIPKQKMNVESIVRWTDSARASGNYEIAFDTILTNWKGK